MCCGLYVSATTASYSYICDGCDQLILQVLNVCTSRYVRLFLWMDGKISSAQGEGTIWAPIRRQPYHRLAAWAAIALLVFVSLIRHEF